MADPIGIVLWHKDHGYCKVLDFDRRIVSVQYCGTEIKTNYTSAAIGTDLHHKPLPIESYARIRGEGVCQILKVVPRPSTNSSIRYVVRNEETGDTAELDEKELNPLETHPKETLMSRLGGCESHALNKVMARHQFILALEDLHNQTGGLEALVGSRVALFPHQAFVAGTVINDSVRRFILADEVGLGKTVEAGVIINDVLSVSPVARVLVLTPGPLSRQWLCELHTSFGAQGFKLADLYEEIAIERCSRVICSINKAINEFEQDFDKRYTWDLVVVDEAHHLLWEPVAYAFVEKLSRISSGLLLLSAVPAREREDELLRLLRLLDPGRYSADGDFARSFTDLYRAQSQLGQGLRILDRDIADLESGEASPDELKLPLGRITGAPVVSDDMELFEACRNVVKMPPLEALGEARRIRDLVVNRYRLSRRIIKNRRSQLISQELLSGVKREYELLPYEADIFELDVLCALERVVRQLAPSPLPLSAVQTFFKVMFLAATDPVCISLLSDELTSAFGAHRQGSQSIHFESSYGASYDEYYDVLEELAIKVVPYLEMPTLSKLADAVSAWIDAPKSKQRFRCLGKNLPKILERHRKVIVFCGAYGSAGSLAFNLKRIFGDEAVEVFAFDLEDEDKEKNVLHFRTNPKCKILVSDETGGEGRNFQFADAIIHYDLPWSVASIEQRIGRIDRIGRTEAVKSYIVYRSSSIEEGLLSCLIDGFRVFSTSISGMEFMLRESEASMLDSALNFEWEHLSALAPQVAVAAERERRTDDAEALTDAGSFPGLAKIKQLNELSDSLEKTLEEKFVTYFRCLAQPGSAGTFADDREPNIPLWYFRPDEIRNEPLPGLQKGEDGFLAEHRGTFQRIVARERRNLDFFCVGNPLFDAVSSVALDRLTGRVFALGVADPDADEGNYVVVGARCGVAPNKVDNTAPLQRRIRRYFFGKRMYLVYRLGETENLKSKNLEGLFKSALDGTKPSCDLRRTGFSELIERNLPEWTTYLLNLQEVISRDVRGAYKQKYGTQHQMMLRDLRKEISELECLPTGPGLDIDTLKSLEKGLDAWEAVIDVIGIMQVAE